MTNDNEMFNEEETTTEAVLNDDGTPKYVDEAAKDKALVHAEEHIKTLESENASYRDDLSTRKTTEDLLQEMKQRQSASESDQSSTQQIDSDSIVEQVEKRLEAKETAKTRGHNQKTVATTLKELFGDKAETHFVDKAQELGLGVKAFEDLAGKSPQAVLSFFDAKPTVTTPHSSGSVNTESIVPTENLTAARKIPPHPTTDELVNAWKACAPKE